MIKFISNLIFWQSIEYFIDPSLFLFVLSLHLQFFILFNVSQSLTQLFIEINDKLTQTILLLICYTFIHSILKLDRCKSILEMSQVRFELSNLSTNITLSKNKFIILVRFFFCCFNTIFFYVILAKHLLNGGVVIK